MRLTDNEKQIIQRTIYKYFGTQIKIFLFGSRLDDSKKGGDIDLYILQKTQEDTTYKRLLTKAKLEELLYKPIDLIVSKEIKTLIDEEALRGEEILL